MFSRRRRPSKASRQNEERQDRARGEGLYRQIRHWLLAMEEYHNLDKAPKRPFTCTYCTGDRPVRHWTYVTLMPRGSTQRRTFVRAAAPLDKIPEDQLRQNVIDKLRSEGFTVDEPRKLPCGCMLFIARPRKLA